MTRWIDHLIIVPVVLPLFAAAAMLLIDERRHVVKAMINVVAILVLGGVSLALLQLADMQTTGAASVHVGVYRLGDWPAPFGIVLVIDRLAAVMLVLTSVLALATAVFSLSRWHLAGAHFHSLFQIQLMGINGAFLTGDLFNLFVFFEVLLAASYGLVLHGSGVARVKAGLHYIVINLAASLLFLIGVSLIYGVTGTLNMADLAARIPQIRAEDRMLLEAGAAILGVAFLVKAGIWPLGFWLPTAYSAAAAPVAAVFAIMSKIGVYVILRLWLLLFGEASGASAGFGGEWLLYSGIATLVFGATGVLASQNMQRLASYSVLVSSGTLVAVMAAGQVSVTSGALFYLVSSTLGLGAFFMLIELIGRGNELGADMIAVTREAYGEDEDAMTEEAEVGMAMPATAALLGLSFIGCALVLAGLPPLSGFLGKFAILSALFGGADATGLVPAVTWVLLALLILSGLVTLIAMVRAGIRTFWTPEVWNAPRVEVIEMAPVMVLLAACALLTVQAEPAMRYMHAAAAALHAPEDYVRSVLSTPVERPRLRTGGS
jgi:multicomponent K+:H+ antiporter subunit D